MPCSLQLILSPAPADAAALRELADAVSSPDAPNYAHYVSSGELPAIDPTLLAWCSQHALQLVEPPTPGAPLRVRGTPAQLRGALGPAAFTRLTDPGTSPRAGRAWLPAHLVARVLGAHLMPDTCSRWLSPMALPRTPVPVTHAPRGVEPREISARYGFPADWHARGETIAVMALGGAIDRGDLEAAWTAWGVVPPQLHAIQVGPGAPPSRHILQRLETTMVVAWLAALAPGARIVVYYIDPALHPDPWLTFLQAVIADDELRPTVATTSWSAPEDQYVRTHGREAFAAALDLATALGISVLAASGDWGALGGLPPLVDGRRVCSGTRATAVFPASEARVLAVGGTMPDDDDPSRDVAWNAALLPALRQALGFERFASGGGFSAHAPAPAWQTGLHDRQGRGYPDVALLAGGFGGDDPRHRAGGYAAIVGGTWRDDAGGTSLAAPIWAAILAGINAARRARGRPRLGCVQPLLYRRTAALREVLHGNSDIPVTTPGPDGACERRIVPGHRAGPGWNPVTGLGVPRVTLLRDMLAGH